jgi:hypothetical protein
MIKENMTIKQLSIETGLGYTTLCPKLTKRGNLTMAEACKIRKTLRINMDLEELFSEAG